MSKVKLGFTALLTLIMLSMFAALASAAPFTPTPSNPAPGINNGTIDNFGKVNAHKTHGNFQNNTNACANCHSTHNGQNARLVKFKNADQDMCMTCHDGTMGFYNVNKATVVPGKPGTEFDGAGVFSTLDRTKTDNSVSMHNVSSGLKLNAAPGAFNNKDTSDFTCSSCHNPHGSPNDRLLKENVVGGTAFAYDLVGVDKVKTPIANGIKTINLKLIDDPAFAAINASTDNSGLKITISDGPLASGDKTRYAQFCAACHDDYAASRSAGRPNHQGQLYTHTSNSTSQGRNCASCHYAHGTDINLLFDSAGNTIADLQKKKVDGGAYEWSEATAKEYMKDVSASGSNNKKFTNMVVCWTCHQSTHQIQGVGTGNVPGGKYDTGDRKSVV